MRNEDLRNENVNNLEDKSIVIYKCGWIFMKIKQYIHFIGKMDLYKGRILKTMKPCVLNIIKNIP